MFPTSSSILYYNYSESLKLLLKWGCYYSYISWFLLTVWIGYGAAITLANTYPENAWTSSYISILAIVELIRAPSNDLFNARCLSMSRFIYNSLIFNCSRSADIYIFCMFAIDFLFL
jgi:hypothetical protein